MIEISDIAGNKKYLNDDLIERMESVPDTVISLVNGQRYIVQDSPAEIIARIIEFRRGIGSGNCVITVNGQKTNEVSSLFQDSAGGNSTSQEEVGRMDNQKSE